MNLIKVEYDYSDLKRKMNDCRYSQRLLAKKVSIGRSSLNLKLNNRGTFTQTEIKRISDVLKIPVNEIGEYFFKVIVQKTVSSAKIN
ncbi:DUF739 family protein [Enterococcus rotai]|uniref:DUF739 family protein n=1 Tax=Enterococcus rotai TaxID=118060 RepID=UPI0032B4EC09